MAVTISSDDIDFSAYALETEPKRKVRSSSVYVGEMIAGLGVASADPKAYLPWDKTMQQVQLRPGEVSLWAGVNGQGKSLMTGLVALSLCSQGERVCIASFEMKPRRTLERMLRQWSGQGAPTYDEMLVPSLKATIVDLYEQFGDWSGRHLWLYDQQGTVQTEQLVGVLRYCAKELRVTHFFVDSLMKCVAGEDDYNGQKNFVDELTAIARDTGMHIHLVHHLKKLGNEEQQPDKMDVKGSGSITDQVDNVFLVWRNKKKEREAQTGKAVAESEPDAMLIVGKQRNGEWEGRIGLFFDKESQQFVQSPGAARMDFFNGFPHRSI